MADNPIALPTWVAGSPVRMSFAVVWIWKSVKMV